MNGYSRHRWVAKTPTGYFFGAPDALGVFDTTLERASRYDSARQAKNAVLAAGVLEMLNNRSIPVIVYERIKESVEIDYISAGMWDASDRTSKLMLIRDISRAIAEAYQWVMTSRDLDYTEWACAVLLPEWEFTDPDDDTVQERLEKINMPCVISNRTIFLKREDDFVAMRLLFEQVILCISLEDGVVILDNRP